MNAKEAAARAKADLERIRGVDRVVRRLDTTYNETAQALSLSGGSGGGVRSSSISDPTAQIAGKLSDLRDEINRQIDLLVDLKREMIGRLENMPNLSERSVLTARYIQQRTWDEIADEEGRGKTWVFEQHGSGLISYARFCLPDTSGHFRSKTE